MVDNFVWTVLDLIHLEQPLLVAEIRNFMACLTEISHFKQIDIKPHLVTVC